MIDACPYVAGKLPAVEREAAAALAMPELTEPVKLVLVPVRRRWHGFTPATWLKPPMPPGPPVRRHGGWDSASIFSPWITCACWPAWRWSSGTSTPPSSSPSKRYRYRTAPARLEFLALLDRARIWAARGQVRDALATVRRRGGSWPGPGRCCSPAPMSWRRCCACRSATCAAPPSLPAGCPPPAAPAARQDRARRRRLPRRAGTPAAASPGEMTPRHALVRQLLLAAAAIGRGDPWPPASWAVRSGSPRRGLPQHGRHHRTPGDQLPDRACPAGTSDPFTEQLIAAALQVRATHRTPRPRQRAHEPLTAAERRVLKLLPTSTCPQIAATLYVRPIRSRPISGRSTRSSG